MKSPPPTAQPLGSPLSVSLPPWPASVLAKHEPVIVSLPLPPVIDSTVSRTFSLVEPVPSVSLAPSSIVMFRSVTEFE